MADSVVTVSDVFELPLPGSPEESSARWQALRQWITEDLGSTKAPELEDVGATVEELLKIPLSDIFLASWKETDAIKELLSESRETPEAITHVELADHTIKSSHHPHIEVRRKKATSKRIDFTLRLLFKLRGFSLHIQNGRITEMRTGPCEMQGTLEYQGLAVAERKNAPVNLPEVVAFHPAPEVKVEQIAPVNESKTGAPEASLKQKQAELIPPVVERDAKPAVVEPAVSPVESETKTVTSTPDLSTLVPPTKIRPKVTGTAPAASVPDAPAEVIPQEAEEEREVFVL